MNESQAPDAPEPVPAAPPSPVGSPMLPPPLPPAVVRPLFSTLALVLCGVLGLGTIVFQAWNYYSQPRLQQLYYPAHTAARIAERTLEYYATDGPAPNVERIIARIMGTDAASATNEAIAVCEDILAASFAEKLTDEDAAALRVVLGTILGESGQTDELAQLLKEWPPKPSDDYLALLSRLYLTKTPVPSVSALWPNSSVMGEWTRDRLSARAASLDGGKNRPPRQDLLERSAAVHYGTAYLVVFISLACLGGLVVILYALITGAGRSLPSEQLAAPWHWRDALGVFLLAEFLGVVFYYWIAWSPLETVRSLAGYLYLVVPLVVLLVLARFILFRRHGLRVRDQFRITRWRPFLAGALALFACEFAGAAVLMACIHHLGLDPRWAESVNEYLIYDPGWARAAILLNMSVIGPCYEELQMRRIVHGTLRARLPVGVAAVLSASLFAFLHFYSLPGFLSVWWFGFSAAMIYERTRSLPACIAGHLLTNLVLGGQQILALG